MEIHLISELINSDSFYSSLENTHLRDFDSWTEWNFRCGVDIGEDITITAFVENAFDEEHFDGSADLTEDLGFAIGFGPARARTWGADIRYRFDM